MPASEIQLNDYKWFSIYFNFKTPPKQKSQPATLYLGIRQHEKKNNIKTLSYSDADPWHMICYSLSFAQHYADV